MTDAVLLGIYPPIYVPVRYEMIAALPPMNNDSSAVTTGDVSGWVSSSASVPRMYPTPPKHSRASKRDTVLIWLVIFELVRYGSRGMTPTATNDPNVTMPDMNGEWNGLTVAGSNWCWSCLVFSLR